MLDKETQRLAKSLYEYIKNKYGFDTDPKIHFLYNKKNAYKHLGMTGHYDPETEEIVIYAQDRHPKDILRSLAHELIHHVQKFEGMLTPDRAAPESDPNYIVHDKFLEEVERDAFARGNVDLRFWEAEQKMSKDEKKEVENVNEGKEVVINDALKNSYVYRPEDRSCNDLYLQREAAIFQELLKKFGIKK